MNRKLPSNITLRPADVGDVELLLEWENDPAIWPYGDTVREYTRVEIETLVARGERFVIEADARPVGTIDLYDHDGKSCGVGVLIYNPFDRRRGYASRALTLLEAWAQEVGLQLWCEIEQKNSASRALFEKTHIQIK